jgi:hypothetical protein
MLLPEYARSSVGAPVVLGVEILGGPMPAMATAAVTVCNFFATAVFLT